jgi:hypothetical protein
MTRSHFGGWAVLAAGLMVAACEDATTDPGGVTGTYQLDAVNGEDLPAVVFDGERPEGHVVATALSGSLTLRSSTFTETIVFNLELNGQDFGSAPVTLTGTYLADGQFLTFEPDGSAPTFTGTVSGGVLTTVENHPDYGVTDYVWSR